MKFLDEGATAVFWLILVFLFLNNSFGATSILSTGSSSFNSAVKTLQGR